MLAQGLPVDIQDDLLDYVSVAISAAVAVITLVAVFVALAPLCRAKRRVPHMTIEPRGEGSVSPESSGRVYVDVRNDTGKDTAVDVEIAVRVQTRSELGRGIVLLTAHESDFFREPEVSLLIPEPSFDVGASLKSYVAARAGAASLLVRVRVGRRR